MFLCSAIIPSSQEPASNRAPPRSQGRELFPPTSEHQVAEPRLHPLGHRDQPRGRSPPVVQRRDAVVVVVDVVRRHAAAAAPAEVPGVVEGKEHPVYPLLPTPIPVAATTRIPNVLFFFFLCHSSTIIGLSLRSLTRTTATARTELERRQRRSHVGDDAAGNRHFRSRRSPGCSRRPLAPAPQGQRLF